MSLKEKFAKGLEKAGGRHDEKAIYDGEPGDPGLSGGPGSMSWEINGDLASLAVPGLAAVLMEVLHPSVMDGVHNNSTFRTEPQKRSKNTLGYVLRTTFGSTPAATRVIEGVKNMHSRVNGTRVDGVSYGALDPELIAWVHTCIPWAIMTAFDRYKRPLSVEEKNRYLTEQALIGRMGGADWVPTTVDELEDYVERMRPHMAVNSQTVEFMDFLCGESPLYPEITANEKRQRRFDLVAAMSLMPDWAQRMTGLESSSLGRTLVYDPYNRLKGATVRWAYPDLPCKQMALRRANAEKQPTAKTAAA